MFGYVTVARDEMKIKDYKIFLAYYCGLCRTIGKNGNQISRLGITFDMTFLSLLLAGVTGEKADLEKRHCLVHLERRTMVKPNRVLSYCADLNSMLTYLKLKDDVQDEHSIKAFFAKIPFSLAARRAKKRHRGVYQQMEHWLSELSKLERENCGEIDRVAGCFAHLMEAVIAPEFIQDDKTRRALAWLGYNMGRWVYVLDAFNDLKKDEKKGSYNPFLIKEPPDKEQLEATLTFTLDNIAKSYELLDIQQNDAVLRNILYLGLKTRQEAVLSGTGEKRQKQEEINGSV